MCSNVNQLNEKRLNDKQLNENHTFSSSVCQIFLTNEFNQKSKQWLSKNSLNRKWTRLISQMIWSAPNSITSTLLFAWTLSTGKLLDSLLIFTFELLKESGEMCDTCLFVKLHVFCRFLQFISTSGNFVRSNSSLSNLFNFNQPSFFDYEINTQYALV